MAFKRSDTNPPFWLGVAPSGVTVSRKTTDTCDTKKWLVSELSFDTGFDTN